MLKNQTNIKDNEHEKVSVALARAMNGILPNVEAGVFLGNGESGTTFYHIDATESIEQLAFLIATAMLQDEGFKESIKLAIRLYNRHKAESTGEHISEALAKVINDILKRRGNNG